MPKFNQYKDLNPPVFCLIVYFCGPSLVELIQFENSFVFLLSIPMCFETVSRKKKLLKIVLGSQHFYSYITIIIKCQFYRLLQSTFKFTVLHNNIHWWNRNTIGRKDVEAFRISVVVDKYRVWKYILSLSTFNSYVGKWPIGHLGLIFMEQNVSSFSTLFEQYLDIE